jgi:hypothetical protein
VSPSLGLLHLSIGTVGLGHQLVHGVGGHDANGRALAPGGDPGTADLLYVPLGRWADTQHVQDRSDAAGAVKETIYSVTVRSRLAKLGQPTG